MAPAQMPQLERAALGRGSIHFPAKSSEPLVRLRTVLGDQLNPRHSWFQTVQPHVVYVLMEMRQETDYVRHHAQKILAVFAAMRDFACQLKGLGHRVHYVSIDDPSNRQQWCANLEFLAQHYGAGLIEYQEPDEWRLDEQIQSWARQSRVLLERADSEHFYTSRHEVATIFAHRKQWLMEHFYRVQRHQHKVLMTVDGHPEGGQWNYDHDNRKPWRGTPAEPADVRPRHDHSALWQTILHSGADYFGHPQAAEFRWPLNRAEALTQLHDFISHVLPHFGDHQDALSTRSWRLFHSLLSFALNVKMLNPREVVNAAESAWRAGSVPLASAEGFIRQILGWREYVRGVYWAHMPGYTDLNQLGHHRPLPHWFWTGHTRMACLSSAIGQSLEHAYAHHIQRLMVIGNFALLAGLNPQALHRWYLGIYIDAFEWVEAPNTLGMSQFADGGWMATKPYVSSAAYLDRMGDHCKQCPYDKKAKFGPQACPFNSLYWDFLDRHQDRLRPNHRLAMIYKLWEKTDPSQKENLRKQAADILSRLDEL